jgi:fibronectin type 3 domain-containing protein
MHTTANGVYTTAAALYLDDVAIPGSYRSVSVKDNNAEYILSNDIIVTIPSGSHKIELKAATTNTSTQIGGVPNIPAPGQSYTSANLRCSRII